METLDLWNMTSVETPTRSRLFSLEPIGMGTSLQESLSSYMVRLAHAHMVTPLVLANRELLPRTNIKVGRAAVGSFTMKDAKTLNGLNKYATEATRCFQELTLRNDLINGTLLPWRDVLDGRATGLLSKHPRWCPFCFVEWRAQGVEPYLPLLWFLTPAKQCPMHMKLLEEKCPHCDRHQPFVPKHYHMDHCSYCGHSLAFVSKPHKWRDDMPGKSFSRFASESVAEMISKGPEVAGFATHDRLREQFNNLIQILGGGNREEMHRRLGLREKTTTGWIRDGQRPTIDSLLLICYRLNLSPVRFLSESLSEKLELRETSFSFPKLNYRRNLTRTQRLQVTDRLKEVLSDPNEVPPLVEVAKQLGHPVTFLRYWWRKECFAISAKHKAYVNERAKDRLRDLRERVAQISREYLRKYPHAPAKRIIEILVAERIGLSWQEVRKVIREIREEFRILPKTDR